LLIINSDVDWHYNLSCIRQINTSINLKNKGFSDGEEGELKSFLLAPGAKCPGSMHSVRRDFQQRRFIRLVRGNEITAIVTY